MKKRTKKETISLIMTAKSIFDDAIATAVADYPDLRTLLSMISPTHLSPKADVSALIEQALSAIDAPAVQEPLLRTKEASSLLQCSPPTLLKLASEGKITPVIIANERRWRREDVLALIG